VTKLNQVANKLAGAGNTATQSEKKRTTRTKKRKTFNTICNTNRRDKLHLRGKLEAGGWGWG